MNKISNELAAEVMRAVEAAVDKWLDREFDPVPALEAVRHALAAVGFADQAMNKRHVFTKMLEQGVIKFRFDATRIGVDVPENLRVAGLSLRIGHGLTPPVTDMDLGDVAVAATLSFNGEPYRCVVPWHAIFAVVLDGTEIGYAWTRDAPAEVVEKAKEADAQKAAARPVLKLVD